MTVEAPRRSRGTRQRVASRRGDGRTLAPTALLVAVVLAIGSLLPILRDALVAARFGASQDGDAYFISTYVAIMLVTIFVAESATPATVVTLTSDVSPVDQQRRGWPLALVLLVAGLALALLALLVALLAEPLAQLLAPGFDAAALTTTADALVATAPAIVFLGLAWLLAGWLNAGNHFVLPALITPLVALGACLPLLFGPADPTRAAFGWSIGAALAFLVLLVVGRVVSRRRRGPRIATRVTRVRFDAALAIALPLLLLTIVTQSTEIADRVIASHVGAGAVTTVSLAKKTIILPSTILVAAVGAVVLPFISRRTEDTERADAFGRTLNLSLFFLLPTAAFLVLLRDDIVRILYGRGEFDADDIRVTAGLLGLYAIALVPTNIGVVLQRTFATLGGIGAARLPLYPYVVAMGCYIPAAWFGARAFGLEALPIAFAAAELAYVAALIIALHRRLHFAAPPILWPAAVALLATAGAALPVALLAQTGLGSVWIETALALGAGGLVYAGLVAWLGHPAATDILAALRRRPPDGEGDRLRVALDITYAGTRDGTGRYGASLARELGRRADVDLLLIRARRFERLPRALRLPLNGLIHLVWVQLVVPFLAWRRRVDVLHMATTAPFVAPCPVVVTIHDGLDFYPALRPSRVWSLYVRWIGVRAARRAEGIITVSEASAAEISACYRIPRERIWVVLHGSELSEQRAPQPNPPATAYVLMVASATRRKNFETALEAVRLVRAAGVEVDLLVVGSVPAQPVETPWLRVRSGIDDAVLSGLYAAAAAVIVPSRHEGFGLPAVEALACGAPVVVSDIPALREVTHGVARSAPPEDAQAFAAQLQAILADVDAERRRIAPLAAWARGLTWQAAAAHTVDVYRQVVASGARGRAWLGHATVGSQVEHSAWATPPSSSPPTAG